jgi:hypothetical protein
MALRSFVYNSWTPIAVGNTASFTAGGYMALQGGSGTQRFRVEEIYMGGQAGASSVNDMLLSRDSTIGVTLSYSTGALDAILDFSAGALSTAVTTFTIATTEPQRSSAFQLLALSFNAFGGIVRWVTSPNEVGIIGVGNTASGGELSLSCSSATGTPGLMSSHIVYEPY